MYSLDVNFLKDRGIQPEPTASSKPIPRGSMTPLVIGVVIGLLLPGIVGGLWLFLQQQNAQLRERDAQLQAQLDQLKIGQKKVDQLNKQIADVKAETEALASVFNEIKPWSAMLVDLRDRIPPGVQISSIQESQEAAAAPASSSDASANNKAAASAPRPTRKLEISGTARSFDDVNYFLLTLQRSAFLKPDETQLVNAELVSNPNKLEVNIPNQQNQSAGRVTYELPKLVQYKIQTNLSDVPASELLRELDRKGAVGLVTRIKSLQEQGVIQP
ncbi:MAG TPA: PilN domain-containing protein [Chroococcales cyanobacterium]